MSTCEHRRRNCVCARACAHACVCLCVICANKCLYMCVCMWVCVFTCMCVPVCLGMCVCVSVWVNVWALYMSVYVCLCMCVCVCVSQCMGVVHVCVCVCVHVFSSLIVPHLIFLRQGLSLKEITNSARLTLASNILGLFFLYIPNAGVTCRHGFCGVNTENLNTIFTEALFQLSHLSSCTHTASDSEYIITMHCKEHCKADEWDATVHVTPAGCRSAIVWGYQVLQWTQLQSPWGRL